MKKKRINCLWNAVVLLAAVAVCLFSLQIPKIWGRWCDERLLSAPVERPLVDGMLGPEGERIPLLKDLYKRRCLSSGYIYGNSIRQVDDWQTDLIKQTCEVVENLARSSAVPKEAICEMTGFPGNEIWNSGEELGFQKVSSAENNFTVQWHQKTELVISYQVNMDETTVPRDVSEFLTNYQKYLGIDDLDDWEAVGQKEGPIQACWSEKGQAYLHCIWKPESFEIGIVSLPPAEIGNMQ